jgi:integral membrane protein (TIGR00529 family)
MTILENIPAIFKMIVIFLLVLSCIRKKLSLGNAFLLGSLFLCLLFGMHPRVALKSMLTSITDPKTLSIAVIVSLIMVLSTSMELAGQMQRMLKNFQGLISRPRLNLISGSKLSEVQLSFVNYWFRHIWEYWWPLYPGILLTTVLTEINLLTIMLIMCPFTAIAVWLGYRALKGPDNFSKASADFRQPSLWPFIRELMPILVVIFPGLGLGILLSKLLSGFLISREIGLILALCAAITWVWYQNPLSKKQKVSTLTSPQLLKMIYMIFGILIFKGILTDSRAAASISQELMQMHIPLTLIAAILPLLVGMSSGIVIAFLGSTLPILVPLIRSLGETQFLPAYAMLIIACGFAGVMLSPLHLCFLLSNEYFAVSIGSVYRYLWLPCVCLIGAATAYFWMLHWLWRWI